MSFLGPIILAICAGLLFGAAGELLKLLLKSEGVQDMECKAITQGDGSKFCRECGVSWDMDEKKEECCPKLRKKPDAEKCEAVQYSDTTVCEACGLSWDTNDSQPPARKPYILRTHRRATKDR